MAEGDRGASLGGTPYAWKISAIYLASCLVNGKMYVGQARNLRSRWMEHRNVAYGKPSQSYSHKTAIARAMRKHGFDNFEFTILEVCEVDRLDEREAFWIDALGTLVPAGYNLAAGGKTAKRAAEVGERISAANKGRRKTPEWRVALSKSRKGFKMSAEQRRKISEVQRGRSQSPESNAKRSAALKGRKFGSHSPERCAAISAGMTEEGKLRTKQAAFAPEVRQRRAASNRGQKRSSEKYSEGQHRRWAIIKASRSILDSSDA